MKNIYKNIYNNMLITYVLSINCSFQNSLNHNHNMFSKKVVAYSLLINNLISDHAEYQSDADSYSFTTMNNCYSNNFLNNTKIFSRFAGLNDSFTIEHHFEPTNLDINSVIINLEPCMSFCDYGVNNISTNLDISGCPVKCEIGHGNTFNEYFYKINNPLKIDLDNCNEIKITIKNNLYDIYIEDTLNYIGLIGNNKTYAQCKLDYKLGCSPHFSRRLGTDCSDIENSMFYLNQFKKLERGRYINNYNSYFNSYSQTSNALSIKMQEFVEDTFNVDDEQTAYLFGILILVFSFIFIFCLALCCLYLSYILIKNKRVNGRNIYNKIYEVIEMENLSKRDSHDGISETTSTT